MNYNTKTIIHFSHQLNNKECIACMPGIYEFHKTNRHPLYRRSNAYQAVNCIACKLTEVFAVAKKGK